MTRTKVRSAGGQDLLLLVHGSYAASDSDGGDAWWQCDSWTWREFCRRLPAEVRVQQRGEVFHWSGENNERARIRAAHQLFDYLTELEQRKQSYHLVGHGHGGSIVWYALRLAERRRQRLHRLRSWATVGTPFLHYRTHRLASLSTIVNSLLAVLLLGPVWQVLRALAAAALGRAGGVRLAPEGGFLLPAADRWTTRLWNGPLTWLWEQLGVRCESAAAGITLGTYTPQSGTSLLDYFSRTAEGLAVFAVASAALFVLLNVVFFLVGLALDTLRLRADQRRDRALLRNYRGLWLGLWSPDDEEILGLKNVLTANLAFVPIIGSWRRALYSEHISAWARPYYWLFAPVYNGLVRPLLNRFVRGYVLCAAQGNNRPGASVARVSVAPAIPYPSDQYPPIPSWLNERIVTAANSQMREAAPQLRGLLASPSLVCGLEKYSSLLTGRELVHTSYFDHPEILDLIVMHIAWSIGKLDAAQRGGAKRELLPWLAEFKRQVDQDLETRQAPNLTATDLSTAPATRPALRAKRRQLTRV